MLRIAPAAYADSGAFSCQALRAPPSPCNEPEMRMLAMFMLAILAMCRALADLLPGADVHCRSRRTGMIAAVRDISQDPIAGHSPRLHSGGVPGRRGGGRYAPAPAWFETG
jgi:hypothetical protein